MVTDEVVSSGGVSWGELSVPGDELSGGVSLGGGGPGFSVEV